MQQIITSEGDMVDQLAYDHYGTNIGTAEAILDANPGLAARSHPACRCCDCVARYHPADP